jgi:hypothetical protein
MPTFTQISTAVTVGSGGAASIDFSSIPSTYTDLIVKLSVRTNVSAVADDVFLAFNGSTSTFTGRYLQGTGSAVVTGTYNRFAGFGTGNTATASTFSNQEIYIPNYLASTNKSHGVDSVSENNATVAQMALVAGLWSTSSAINQITLTPVSGTLFLQYSTAYLYGVSNA